MTNAPLQSVAAAIDRLHPLQDNDEGHFICSLMLKDGRTFSVHGVLTSLDQLEARIFTPAAAQLTHMVEK